MTDNLVKMKLKLMLEMQDEINTQVDSDWRARSRAWSRAIWVECAEIMDHYGGWKWWKQSDPDIPQVLLEIVDVWHFGLSLYLNEGGAAATVAERLAEDFEVPYESQGFLQDVEDLACVALVEERFEASIVPALLDEIGKDFDDLYKTYVGKNTLNAFRQANGYQSGCYQKSWSGREDNEHLFEILRDLDVDSDRFKESLYARLDERYSEAVGRN